MRVAGKGVMIAVVFGIVGFATLSFAAWGNGCPNAGDGSRGMGWHHKGGGRCGMDGNYGSLSDADLEKLNQRRSEFFKATEEVRGQLYEKELALRSELAKENPDSGKASGLQKEISDLQSELDQKRLNFQIETRKELPEFNRAFRGHGRMMGKRSGGGGYCWK